MKYFVKSNNDWQCFKGTKSKEKAIKYATKLFSKGIHSSVYAERWILIHNY